MDRVQQLIDAIEGEDPNHWSDEWLTAVNELAEIRNDPRVVICLCNFLRVKDNRWFAGSKRAHAIHALGRIRDPKSLQPLCDVLDDTKDDSQLSTNSFLLDEIIRIITSFGDAALEPLCRKLKYGKSAKARGMAVFGLRFLGNRSALPVLRSRLRPLIGERDRFVLDGIRQAIA